MLLCYSNLQMLYVEYVSDTTLQAKLHEFSFHEIWSIVLCCNTFRLALTSLFEDFVRFVFTNVTIGVAGGPRFHKLIPCQFIVGASFVVFDQSTPFSHSGTLL